MHCLSALVLTLAVSSISSATRVCETADVYMEHMAGGFNFDSSITIPEDCTKLSIGGHNEKFGDASAIALAEALRDSFAIRTNKLEAIDLNTNHVGDAGAEALVEALEGHASVISLDLWDNK
eukprot:gene27950-17645_t